MRCREDEAGGPSGGATRALRLARITLQDASAALVRFAAADDGTTLTGDGASNLGAELEGIHRT